MKICTVGFVRGFVGAILLVSLFIISSESVFASDITINVDADIASTTPWTSGNIYIINGGIDINNGVTLNIQPGAIVKFTQYGSLTVHGTLNAVGSTTLPIYLTSLMDDNAGGTPHDTNGDGSTTPNLAYWDMIEVDSGGNATIENAEIRYGGARYYSSPVVFPQPMIINFGGSISLSTTTFDYFPDNGIGTALYNGSGTTTVKFSDIGNAGFGLYQVGGSLTVSTSTIHDNVANGIYAPAESTGILSINGNTFADNPYAAQIEFVDSKAFTFNNKGNNSSTGTGVNGFYLSGTLGADQTFGWDKIAYVVPGLTVPTGKSLTMKPGAAIKFADATSDLIIDGSLLATGEVGIGGVYFTSLKDDIVKGDTNGDGVSTPQSGDWLSIKVGSTGTTTLYLAIVTYGGNTSGCCSPLSMIRNNGGMLSISSSTMASSSSAGVYNAAGTTTITTSDIAYNYYGLYHSGGSSSVVSSIIHGNFWNGVYNDTTSYIDAITNYWGANSGPHHYLLNALGAGDEVSDYVYFDPWVDDPYFSTSTVASVNTSSSTNCYLNYDVLVPANDYDTEITSAAYEWNNLTNSRINVVGTSTNKTLEIVRKPPTADVPWKGEYHPELSTKQIWLNPYYLDSDTNNQIQNTIQHELGHALGLGHSYLGNIMNYFQTNQISFGPQDLTDYQQKWVGTCEIL